MNDLTLAATQLAASIGICCSLPKFNMISVIGQFVKENLCCIVGHTDLACFVIGKRRIFDTSHRTTIMVYVWVSDGVIVFHCKNKGFAHDKQSARCRLRCGAS